MSFILILLIIPERIVLEASYHKQKEIKALYEAEGIDINPLVLIQLPNSDEGEHKKESIKINDNDIYVSFKTKPDDWKFFE